MIIISHLLTGAAIGGLPAIGWRRTSRRAGGQTDGKTKKILLVFIFGAISHFLLDALPHWDYVPDFEAVLQPANLLKVVLDFVLAVLILGLVIRFFIKRKTLMKSRTAVFVGAGAALLPDFLGVVKLFFNVGMLNALSVFHNSVHCLWQISFWQGLPIFLIFSLGAVLFLIYAFNPRLKSYSLAKKEILVVEEER